MLKAKRASDSATPLRSLTAAVMDTETTSLDVRKARIVEIGVAPLVDSRMDHAGCFATSVDPGEPIPEASRCYNRNARRVILETQKAKGPGYDPALQAGHPQVR
jgi:hypothetical protein